MYEICCANFVLGGGGSSVRGVFQAFHTRYSRTSLDWAGSGIVGQALVSSYKVNRWLKIFKFCLHF